MPDTPSSKFEKMNRMLGEEGRSAAPPPADAAVDGPGGENVPNPEAAKSKQLAGEILDDLKPQAVDPNERPRKQYAWIDETDFNVIAMLAGQVQATLQVFKGEAGVLQLTFRELFEEEKTEVEVLLAPKVNGGRHFYINEQISRAATIGYAAACISKWDGESWMKDKSIEDRIKALRKGRSLAIMDKILGAYNEFQTHLIWLSGQLDPKDS